MSASPSSSPGGVKLPSDLGAFFGGIAIVISFAAAAFVAIRHAIQAPDAVYDRYNEPRRRTRASIVSDRVLPELASLIVTVNAEASKAGQVLHDRETIADILVSVGYMESLGRLSELYGDYSDIERYEHDVVTWARIKGVAAAVFLIAFLVVVVWLVFNGLTVVAWIVIASAIALAGATVSGTSWVQETLIRNRMTKVFRKYE